MIQDSIAQPTSHGQSMSMSMGEGGYVYGVDGAPRNGYSYQQGKVASRSVEVRSFQVAKDRIGLVVGKGHATIKRLQRESGTDMSIVQHQDPCDTMVTARIEGTRL